MGLLWKCLIVVAASSVQSLGLTLQRLSYLDPPLPSSGVWPTPDQRTHSVRLWRTGIALFVGANLFGSTVQLAVLPLVLVCTLQAIGLVANSVFASLILKEPLTPYALLGTVLVICGAVIVAGSGGPDDPDLSLDELLELFESFRFSIWMSFTILLVIILLWQKTSGYPKEFWLGRIRRASVSSGYSNDGDQEQTDMTTSRLQEHNNELQESQELPRLPPPRPQHDQPQRLDSHSNYHQEANTQLAETRPLMLCNQTLSGASESLHLSERGEQLYGSVWGFIGGIASAHSLLMAKIMIGLLVRDYRNILIDLRRTQFWVILVLFLTFAVGQMWCVNNGLKHTSTSVLYPLVFCVYNVMTLLNSVMLYGTDLVAYSQLAWIVLGTLVLVAGVLLLSTRFEAHESVSLENENLPVTGGIRRWLDRSRNIDDEEMLGFEEDSNMLQDQGNNIVLADNSTSMEETSPDEMGKQSSSTGSPSQLGAGSTFQFPPWSHSGFPDHLTIGRTRSSHKRTLTAGSGISAHSDGGPARRHHLARSASSDTRLGNSMSSGNRVFSQPAYLLPRRLGDYPALTDNQTYTSFDSISPNITNPDKVRGRHSRVVLSREQHKILRELGM